jgi:ribose/xylose/arabinose/galactoside ABC-type transport system permease subunit
MTRPGSFTATGTFLAVVLIALGENGLILLAFSAFVGQVFTGNVKLER